MGLIRLKKEYGFEMSHALYGHPGPCNNIHGHSYVLSVTIKGEPLLKADHPANGMLLDFYELDRIVNKLIVDKFEHFLVLDKRVIKPKLLDGLSEMGVSQIIHFDGQPTCENLVLNMADTLSNAFPEGISLHSLKLKESPGALAELHGEDN